MTVLAQILLSAPFMGSLYAMIAVGLRAGLDHDRGVQFLPRRLHDADAYVAWQFVSPDAFGLPMAVSLPLSMLVVAALGFLLQASVVRPFIGRGDVVLVAVITTLAASSALENGTQLVWGPRSLGLPALIEGNVDFYGIGISLHQVAIIVITPVILGAVWLFLNRMRLGLALRAVSQNEDACHLVGINVTALYALAFGLAAALAALAGVFFGGFKFMSPQMGTEPLSKALVVVIFGGVANISGPIMAAYIIALFEAISTYVIGFYSTPALLFAVLIAVFMVKPKGLFAGRTRGLA